MRMRYNILMHDHPDNLHNVMLSKHNNHATNAEFLLILARHLISQDKRQELNHYLDSINRHATFKLYEPCFGMRAPDGNYFQNGDQGHTEILFMREARFTLRPDGRMCIPLLGNKAYSAFYTIWGGFLSDKFMEEMQALTQIMGLHIEELVLEKDINATEEERLAEACIIFDKPSSERLMKNFCHIDREFVKKLLRLRHDMTLMRMPKDDVQSDEPLGQLPVGILKMIGEYYHSHLYREVNPGYVNGTLALSKDRLFELTRQDLTVQYKITQTHHLKFIQVFEDRNKFVAVLQPELADPDAGTTLAAKDARQTIVRHGRSSKPVNYYIITSDKSCRVEPLADTVFNYVKSNEYIERITANMQPVLPMITDVPALKK
jgi:hypothetical protein